MLNITKNMTKNMQNTSTDRSILCTFDIYSMQNVKKYVK